MKKLNLFTGGHRLRVDDILHLQDGLRQAIQQIAIHLKGGSDSSYILFGCDITGTGPFDVSAGVIYYNGEILLVDAATGITTTNNLISELDWDVLETVVAPSPVTYQDTTLKDVHIVRKAVLVDNTVTFGEIGSATTILPIVGSITTDLVGAPALPWDDSDAETGINSGSTLTEYIQAILDIIGELRSIIGTQYGGLNEFKSEIQLINGNLFPAVIGYGVETDSTNVGNISGSTYYDPTFNANGGPYGVGNQGLGNKTLNTLYFNNTTGVGLYNNGNNWQGNKYVVPEDGTYNFFIENLVLVGSIGTQNSGPNGGDNEVEDLTSSSGLTYFGMDNALYNTLYGNPTVAYSSVYFRIVEDIDLVTALLPVDVYVTQAGPYGSVTTMNLGVTAQVKVSVLVRRSGLIIGYVSDGVYHAFSVIEITPGVAQAQVGIISWSTVAAPISFGIPYDSTNGLTLQAGDEVYYCLFSGNGNAGGYTACVPKEGTAFCEKTS